MKVICLPDGEILTLVLDTIISFKEKYSNSSNVDLLITDWEKFAVKIKY